jgi:hypothetical protein
MHRHHIDEQPIEAIDAALAGDQAPSGDQFLEIFGIDQRLGAGFAKLALLPGRAWAASVEEAMALPRWAAIS